MTQTFRFVVEIPGRSVHDVKNALTSIGARVLRVVAKRDPNSTVALDLVAGDTVPNRGHTILILE
jgi:hypothetical protein